MRLDHRAFVLQLIKRHRCAACAEVGVWKGELSRRIMESGHVSKLIMVDPLKLEFNLFEHSSTGPSPRDMKSGVYRCDMGEPLLSQDKLDQLYARILQEMRRYGDRVRFIRKSSVEASHEVEDRSLDLVFIDAVHLYENVKEDIASWWPKVRNTGIIAGDDYHDQFEGVIAAVNESFPPSVLRVDPSSHVWYVMKSDLVGGARAARPSLGSRLLRWIRRDGVERPRGPADRSSREDA